MEEDIYKNLSIPELEKQYDELLILSSYADNCFYYGEIMCYIKRLIKELKDR